MFPSRIADPWNAKYPDKNAPQFPGNSAAPFHGNNVPVFQDRVVHQFLEGNLHFAILEYDGKEMDNEKNKLKTIFDLLWRRLGEFQDWEETIKNPSIKKNAWKTKLMFVNLDGILSPK